MLRQLLQNNASGHKYLESKGYYAAFTADDIEPTSLSGGNPDWVYVKSFIKVHSVQVIEFLDLSDHNGLLLVLSNAKWK